MAKYRYLAEWVAEQGHDGNGDADPYKDKHATQAFDVSPGFDLDDPSGEMDPAMEAAAKHGCEQNCYGSECYVYVQEYAYDSALFEDIGRKVYSWWDVEKYLCADGGIVERVD